MDINSQISTLTKEAPLSFPIVSDQLISETVEVLSHLFLNVHIKF